MTTTPETTHAPRPDGTRADAPHSERAGSAGRPDAARTLIRPTLPALWSFLSVALPALAAIVAPLAMVDLGFNLRAGDQILSGQGIPTFDTWTFTAAGQPWLDQQWLGQVVLAAAFRLAGWTGLVLLRALLVGATFALVAIAIGARNGALGRRSIALLTLAAFVLAAPALALRPQLLGIVLFAATLCVLAVRHERPSLVWVVPILAAGWANVHGSFVLAPVLVALAWVEDVHERAPRRHRLVVVAAVTGIATLLNPVGVAVWGYVATLSSNPTIAARVSEWQPTTLHDPIGALFWVSAAAVGVLLARRSATTPWPALLALGVFAVLGAWSARGVVWWALAAAIVVARLLPVPAPRTRPLRGSVANAGLALVVALAGVAALPTWRATDLTFGTPSGFLTYAPVGIGSQLRAVATSTPASRVWAPQVWTSWFEWAVPQARYAVDSRIELFPPSVWADADTVEGGGTDALTILDGVDAVVTRHDDERLTATLRGARTWTCRYGDADGRLWLKATAPDASGVAGAGTGC